MRPTFIIAAAAGFAALPMLAGPAWAQANRTFVSGTGSDANPCSLSAPCRSFAQALTQTNPGGEIAVLDTAGYGTVTITKAVSIVNQEGVEAGVTATTGDAITVAANASDVVNLRGLTVVGLGATNGINFTSGGTLQIDKCEIRGFATGISMATSAAASMTVSDTTVSGNINGMVIDTSDASTVTLARLHATHNSTAGVSVSPVGHTATGNVLDSLLDNNGIGIAVTTTASTGATVTVDNSKIVASPGADSMSASGANSFVTLGRTLIDKPQLNAGGHFQTWGNNQSFGPGGNAITF